MTATLAASAPLAKVTAPAVKRAVVLLANAKTGANLEERLLAMIRAAGGEFRQVHRVLTGPGGKRVYDALVKIGDELFIVEAKTGLPQGGGAFRRMLGQIRTFSNPDDRIAKGLKDAPLIVIHMKETAWTPIWRGSSEPSKASYRTSRRAS